MSAPPDNGGPPEREMSDDGDDHDPGESDQGKNEGKDKPRYPLRGKKVVPKESADKGKNPMPHTGESTSKVDEGWFFNRPPAAEDHLIYIPRYEVVEDAGEPGDEVLRQRFEVNDVEATERLRTLMRLIGQFERTARPLLVTNNWDVEAAAEQYNRESAARRARMIERLEQAGHANREAFTRPDGDFQRGYLEPIPSEGRPSRSLILHQPVPVRSSGLTAEEEFKRITILREVITVGNNESLRRLLRSHDWDGNAAFDEYLRHPNRLAPAQTPRAQAGASDPIRPSAVLPIDRESIERQSDILAKLLGALYLKKLSVDIDVALFVLRTSNWDFEQALENFEDLQWDLHVLCHESKEEIESDTDVEEPGPEEEEPTRGTSPGFEVEDWWSAEIDWVKAIDSPVKPNPSFLWYRTRDRTGKMKWYNFKHGVDWTDKDSLERLEKWRRQVRRRRGAPPERPAVTKFLPPENDEILKLHKDATDAAGGKRFVGWKNMTTRYNDKFEGKTIPGSSDPRPARSTSSLQTQYDRLKRPKALPKQTGRPPVKGQPGVTGKPVGPVGGKLQPIGQSEEREESEEEPEEEQDDAGPADRKGKTDKKDEEDDEDPNIQSNPPGFPYKY